MNKNSMEEVLQVLWWASLLALHEGEEVQQFGKLASVVDLDSGVCHGVVLEPLQVEVQHGRELLKDDSLLRVLEQ